MSIPFKTISDLTNGQIPSLEELTVDGIERFLGRDIQQSAPDPQFHPESGAPLLDLQGHQICLPFRHVVALVGEILRREGMLDAKTTHDVAHLELPCSKPTDVILFTQDHLVVAVRSNATTNAVGRCLTAAAGFPQVVDGTPEDIWACGVREAKEELGIQIGLNHAKELPLIGDWPIRTYGFDETSRAAIVISTIGVQLQESLSSLMGRIKLNYESAGLVTLSIPDLLALSRNPSAGVAAQLWPSDMLRTMPARSGVALLSIARNSPTLTPLRHALLSSAMAKKSGRAYAVQPPISISVNGDDFRYNGLLGALTRSVVAAKGLASPSRHHTKRIERQLKALTV